MLMRFISLKKPPYGFFKFQFLGAPVDNVGRFIIEKGCTEQPSHHNPYYLP
jgi:hypothetical protein